MKNSFCVALALLTFSSMSLAQTQELPDATLRSELAVPKVKPPKFEVSLQTTTYSYKESKMENEGTLSGVAGKFSQGFNDVMWASGEVDYFSSSDLTYHGGLQDGQGNIVQELTTPTEDTVLDYNAKLGWTVLDEAGLTAELFLGYGKWSLKDKGSGEGSYRREQVYTYVPLGGSLSSVMDKDWTLAGSFELDVFLGGENTTHLEDTSPTRPTLKFKQNDGSGYKFAATATRNFDGWQLVVEPYFRVWRIGDSEIQRLDATSGFMEPENNTRMVGVKVGVAL